MDISHVCKRVLNLALFVLAGLSLWALVAHAVVVEGVTPDFKFKVMRVTDQGNIIANAVPTPAQVDQSSATFVNVSPSTATLVLPTNANRLGHAFCNMDLTSALHCGDVGISTNTGYVIPAGVCDTLDGPTWSVVGEVYCLGEGNNAIKTGITTIRR